MSLKEIVVQKIEFLLPKYTEVTLFLTSLIAFLIFITEVSLRNTIIDFFKADISIAIVLLFILIGFALSIYYAFTDKKIPSYHKEAMLAFMLVVNVFVGMSAMFYLANYSHGWTYIFPAINYFNALFLGLAFKVNAINADSILDIQAKRSELLLGSAVVMIIFIYSRYVLNDYWAITFSMCLAYATTINEIINKILFQNKSVI